MIMTLVVVVVVVLGQRKGVDDVVLVLHRLVEPGVVAAATGDDDIGFVGLGNVGSCWLEVVRVYAVAGDNGLDVDIDVSLRGVHHCLRYVGPDGGRGDDVDGVIFRVCAIRTVGIVAAGGTGGQRCAAKSGGEEEGGGAAPSAA